MLALERRQPADRLGGVEPRALDQPLAGGERGGQLAARQAAWNVHVPRRAGCACSQCCSNVTWKVRKVPSGSKAIWSTVNLLVLSLQPRP